MAAIETNRFAFGAQPVHRQIVPSHSFPSVGVTRPPPWLLSSRICAPVCVGVQLQTEVCLGSRSINCRPSALSPNE
jgi:hypothetical protein